MPSRSWTRGFAHLRGRTLRWAEPTEEWRRGKQRVLRVEEWEDHLPRPWLANVGAVSSTEVSWFVAGAKEFIERVTDDLRERRTPRRNGRAKHLLALPVIGTRFGGKRHFAGDVVRALVPALQALATAKDVDIALVTNDEPTYASAQAQRGIDPSAWPDLDNRLWRMGENLASVAANGDLVLFIGAGVSKNAGLPDWGGLLRGLAREAGMNDELSGPFRISARSIRPAPSGSHGDEPSGAGEQADSGPSHCGSIQSGPWVFPFACPPRRAPREGGHHDQLRHALRTRLDGRREDGVGAAARASIRRLSLGAQDARVRHGSRQHRPHPRGLHALRPAPAGARGDRAGAALDASHALHRFFAP